jgi:hypothetical protein
MRIRSLPTLALAALALLHAPAARAGDEEKKAAAAEKAFAEAYAAAGEDEKGRAKVVESLSGATDGVKVSVLLERVLPKDDAPPVQTAAVAVLRRVKDEAALKAMAEVATGKGSWNVRGPVFEALGATNSPVAVAALRLVLKSSETRVLAASLFALAEGHPPEVMEDVKKLLVHDQWQVRLAALDYFGRLADRSTLPLLVERLDDETGRLRQEVVETLKAVSGKDYGRDVAKWRAYAAAGEKAAEEAGKKPADPAAGGGGSRAVATGAPPVEPTYYGQKVYSDRVVFIIDVSLSMNEEMVVDRDMIIRETGAVVSGGDNPGGEGSKPDKEAEKKDDDGVIPIEWWKIRTRMDFARSQLKYVVSTLKRDQRFDIVWFSDSIKAWQGGMVPALPATKWKAVQWLDELKCEAGTNTWGGLMKGLNLVGRGGADENYTRGADTLYFMSDGAPSVGDIKDPEQIVAAIERIHKVRRVKVNVVQIGTSPLPFMKRLASVTGGDYKFFNAKGPKR